MELKEALAHLGKQNMNRIEGRAREALPHYMWTDGKAKHRVGYCTNCLNTDIPIRQEMALPDWVTTDPYEDSEESEFHHPEHAAGFRGPWRDYGARGQRDAFTQSGRHNDFGVCPICGSLVQYKSRSMGRKKVSDRILLIRYQQSAVEERTLVMAGWLVICDWGEWDDCNEWLPDLYVDLREICVFRPGKGGERFTKRAHTAVDWETPADENGYLSAKKYTEWHHDRKCVSGYDPWCGPFRQSNTMFMLDQEALDGALAGTPWEALYARIGIIGLLDRIDFFQAVMKYPCIEYLLKLGYVTLAEGLAAGTFDRRLLNLRGKTAREVLRVDASFYGWLKGNRIDAHPCLLEMYQVTRKMGWTLGNDALLWLSGRTDAETLRFLGKRLRGGLLKKAVRYMQRKGVLSFEYRDHLTVMERLGMDMGDERMLFPPSFRETHAELSARVRILESREANEKVARRAAELWGWQFSALGLTIRPFLTADEIIREGNEMRHCVGTYVDRYMAGGTVLLALREDERLDKPWRTVEYTNGGKLVQCRGYRNQCPEDEQERIDRFFALFDRFRAEYKRVRVTPHPSAAPTPSPQGEGLTKRKRGKAA